MKRSIKSLVFLSFLPFFSQAQMTLERAVVGNTGDDASAGTLSLSWTAGEAAVGAYTTGTLIVTEGFQQADQNAVGVDEPHSGSSEITVYPNPVADQLFFRVQVERPITLRATLFDLTGKRVRQVPEFKVLESYQGQIDMSDLPAGEWLLRFEREDQMVLQTLRVTKLR